MAENYWTHLRPDGKWGTKKEGASRDSRVFDTQQDSWDYTQDKARESGGEAYLKNKKGKIRERNTYGKDPYPPKG